MPNNIAFRNIPSTLRLPLFWAEVDPSMANSNTQNQRSLIIGQSLSFGGSNTTTGALSAGSSTTTLTFTAVPSGVQIGQTVSDITTPAAIPAGTTVVAKTATTVTLSAAATGALSADVILFVLTTAGINSTSITSATSSTTTLTFAAGAVPSTVQAGQYVQDLTAPAAIPIGTTVLSKTATTVTLSAAAAAVGLGDTILFSNLSPQLISSAIMAVQQFGAGSMLADMVGRYRQNDTFGELWVLPLVDDPSAVVATGSITVGGTPTVNGTIPMYVNGVLLQVGVTTTMTATNIATALAAAINTAVDPYTGIPVTVTATSAAGVVTITARNKGAAGNDNDIRFAYLGASGGEVIPAGITLTVVPISGGAANPSTLMNILLNTIIDQPYDFIAMPYTDAASLNATQNFMNDVAGRWSWARQDYGHVFSAADNTVALLQTLGIGRNDQHASIMGYFSSPSPSWQWSAAFDAACANSLRADPGLPLHTVPLLGILAPPQPNRFQQTDRQTFGSSGISTYTVTASGQVQIEMAITTYQTNAYGVADDSYLKVETMFLLMAVLRYMKAGVTTVMGRKKLADDGTRVSPGSNVVTPVIIKAYLITLFQQMYNLGWVQEPALFAANVAVQRNQLNPNRVDVLWPGELINQLDIFALLAQFRLSSQSYDVQLAF